MNKNYGIHNIELFSRYCYYAGLAIGLLGLVSIALIVLFHIPVTDMIPVCSFYAATGYYCPGCGGTRAVIAILQGDVVQSLYYHPFVAYILAYYIVYEVSHVLDMVTHGKIRGLRFWPPYFYVGIVVIVVQCIVKNYFRFRYGIPL